MGKDTPVDAEGASERCADVGGPRLAVIVFSKDRPYQLACCLASLLRHVCGAILDISVLFRASQLAFRQSYTVVESLFAKACGPNHHKAHSHASIFWEEETDTKPLGIILEESLHRAESLGAAGLLFTVDDALWFTDFQAGTAVHILQSDPSVYAIHAKLCPRIEYAHPNDKFMRLPRFVAFVESADKRVLAQSGPVEPNFLLYDLSQGEYDWNYPWELSASIYRIEDVREMLMSIKEHFGQAGIDHPNTLEGYGVRLFKQQRVKAAAQSAKCACSSYPVVAVVTINRVQTLFENPVYCHGDGKAGSSETSPEVLDCALRHEVRRAAEYLSTHVSGSCTSHRNLEAEVMAEHLQLPADWLSQYLQPGECKVFCETHLVGLLEPPALTSLPPVSMLPVAPYRHAYLDSVHVPLLGVHPGSPQKVVSTKPMVSWLMPVYNTPADWLNDAWLSICSQTAVDLVDWELVVVDDCSESEETIGILLQWESLSNVSVIRLTKRCGIAGALNAGWRHCQGTFVARLDGDDVAHRDRLQRQLAFFEAHPSVSILGGGFRTFKSTSELLSADGLAGSRQYRMPCHPILARWHMLFSCSLAHPTVTFRKNDFAADPGPYPDGEEAEDHCCWLGLPLDVQVANLADVVGFLRRHAGSRSASAAAAIRGSSYRAVRRFLGAHCDKSVYVEELTEDDIAVLWGCGSASSAEQAQRLSRALDAMEKLFVGLLAPTCGSGEKPLPQSFYADFVEQRAAALQEYVRASCNKLRGLLTVQSLAAGDLSSGTEMMKMWLKGGDAGLKSLAALVNAGFPGQGGQLDR